MNLCPCPWPKSPCWFLPNMPQYKQSFFPRTIIAWNKLNSSTVQASSPEAFKLALAVARRQWAPPTLRTQPHRNLRQTTECSCVVKLLWRLWMRFSHSYRLNIKPDRWERQTQPTGWERRTEMLNDLDQRPPRWLSARVHSMCMASAKENWRLMPTLCFPGWVKHSYHYHL